MKNDPYLSVIIPAYTEGELLGRTLLEIDHHLRLKDFRYEILVIVDGSPNNTGEFAKNCINRVKNWVNGINIHITILAFLDAIRRFSIHRGK